MSNENKKLVISPENPSGILVDLSDEEISQRETDITNAEAERQAEETAKQQKADLKASAKAKLMSGEALTEDEANTIVL
jgi:hypothetical protein